MKNILVRQTIAIMTALVILPSTFLQALPSDTMVATHSAAEHQYDVSGTGWLSKLLCIGCGTAILLAGGSSVIGLLIITAAFPQAVYGCVSACITAYK